MNFATTIPTSFKIQKINFSKEVNYIDLDAYEQKRSPHRLLSTVDTVVGITFVCNGKRTNERSTLIEFRLRNKNINNLHLEKLKETVLHSKELLSSYELIHTSANFIFFDQIIQRFRSRFFRKGKADKTTKNFRPLTIDELYDVLCATKTNY